MNKSILLQQLVVLILCEMGASITYDYHRNAKPREQYALEQCHHYLVVICR